jgi:hypothetical protein
MDVSDASYYIQENNENKGSQMGHTKKKNIKKSLYDMCRLKDYVRMYIISFYIS